MFLPSSSRNKNDTNWNKVNILAKDVERSKKTQVFNDKTDRRVLLGKGKDDFYGLKVSKPGYDVYDATDDELAFNSNNNVFKIVDTMTVSLARTASTTYALTVTPHGLSYIPVVMGFIDNAGTYQQLPWTQIGSSGGYSGHIKQQLNVFADSTNVVVEVITPDNAANNFYPLDQSWTIKVYLLQETAN